MYKEISNRCLVHRIVNIDSSIQLFLSNLKELLVYINTSCPRDHCFAINIIDPLNPPPYNLGV